MASLLCTIGVLAGAACANSESRTSAAPEVVHWTASPTRKETRADGSTLVTARLTARVDSGWKFYSLEQKGTGPLPMLLGVDSAALHSVVKVEGPSAVVSVDPVFGDSTATYSGTPEFTVSFEIPPGAKVPESLSFAVRAQACSDSICLPPRSTRVTVPTSAVKIGN